MLKKLFKYEWKFFWKVPTVINAFLIIMTMIGVISLASPFWGMDITGIEIMLGLAIFFYILAIAACSIGVTAYIAIRYYKNVYTDEGYLTNTLPVTARQIVLSKLFTGMLWSFITSAVVILSVLSLVYTAMLSYEEIDIIYEFFKDFAEFLPSFKDNTGISFSSFLLLSLIYLVLSTALSILKMYVAIALGQLFTRHKVAGAVIWYIGEYVVFEIITSFLYQVPTYNNGLFYTFFSIGIDYYYNFSNSILSALLISIGLSFAFCAGLYFITEHMLKTQLNLD